MKYVLITGVSTGIGKASVLELLKRGFYVFGSVRNLSDAENLKAEFGSNFTPLIFDVTDRQAINSAAAIVKDITGSSGLSALINNAGIGLGAPLMHQSIDEIRYYFEVNVLGVISVTQAFLPMLGAQRNSPYKPGRIINLSSVSGKFAYPFLGAYAASKHALEAISDALRRELMIYGIDVIVIEPGSVKTEIWDKVERQDYNLYSNTDYGNILNKFRKTVLETGRKGMPPFLIAHTVRKAIETKHPKTRYPLPNSWLTGWLLPSILPDRIIDWVIAKAVGLK